MTAVSAPRALTRVLGAVALVVLGLGCSRQEEPRRYTEIEGAPPRDPHAGMAVAPRERPAALPPAETSGEDGALRWQTPAGWTARGASGMRLATLSADDSGAECTIVRLGAMAGGARANVIRWLGQLQIDLAEDALAAFLQNAPTIKADGGFTGPLYDFTGLVDEGDAMLAAMFELEDATLFVKMLNSREVLVQERARFRSLCESLTF